MKYTFPSHLRIKKRVEFLAIQRNSTRFKGKYVIIEVSRSSSYATRLGMTVTKRYGKAFKRNRFKRIVREAFRLNQYLLPDGYDLIVKPRTLSLQAKSTEIGEEIVNLLESL